MLKRIIIISTVILIPTAFYVASTFGKLDRVNFQQAVEIAASDVEGDQAPKVLITATIVSTTGPRLLCKDQRGSEFSVDYTGKPLAQGFNVDKQVEFVGHVHAGETPYFHATQALTP